MAGSVGLPLHTNNNFFGLVELCTTPYALIKEKSCKILASSVTPHDNITYLLLICTVICILINSHSDLHRRRVERNFDFNESKILNKIYM